MQAHKRRMCRFFQVWGLSPGPAVEPAQTASRGRTGGFVTVVTAVTGISVPVFPVIPVTGVTGGAGDMQLSGFSGAAAGDMDAGFLQVSRIPGKPPGQHAGGNHIPRSLFQQCTQLRSGPVKRVQFMEKAREKNKLRICGNIFSLQRSGQLPGVRLLPEAPRPCQR